MSWQFLCIWTNHEQAKIFHVHDSSLMTRFCGEQTIDNTVSSKIKKKSQSAEKTLISFWDHVSTKIKYRAEAILFDRITRFLRHVTLDSTRMLSLLDYPLTKREAARRKDTGL